MRLYFKIQRATLDIRREFFTAVGSAIICARIPLLQDVPIDLEAVPHERIHSHVKLRSKRRYYYMVITDHSVTACGLITAVPLR